MKIVGHTTIQVRALPAPKFSVTCGNDLRDSCSFQIGVVSEHIPKVLTRVRAGFQVTDATVLAALSLDMQGTVTIIFAPDAVVNDDDPAIQFLTTLPESLADS